MSTVAQATFSSYPQSVTHALDAINADQLLPRDGLIVLKPNLTTPQAPPVTTDVRFTAAVLDYCRRHTRSRVIIAEGAGTGSTWDAYRANGYDALARERGVDLVDLNEEESDLVQRNDTFSLREFHLPRVLRDAFVISLPVLKDHSITVTTIALKNMFGIAPEPFYGGSFNKARLHSPCTHRSVVDVCLYCPPALSVVDARVALTGGHLSGTPKALNVILAGRDPVAVDAYGSRLLGHVPERIEYLRLADGCLGALASHELLRG